MVGTAWLACPAAGEEQRDAGLVAVVMLARLAMYSWSREATGAGMGEAGSPSRRSTVPVPPGYLTRRYAWWQIWQAATVNSTKHSGRRRRPAVQNYPMWLVAVITVVLLVLPWVIALALVTLDATVVGILAAVSIPLAGLWLTWVGLAKGGGSSVKPSAEDRARTLRRVRYDWIAGVLEPSIIGTKQLDLGIIAGHVP